MCRHLLFLKHKEDKHIKNQQKEYQDKGGSLPSSSRSTFSLLTPTSTFLFQMFSPSIFFFSSRRRKKKKQRKKNHRKKKVQRRERAFLQAPTLPFHFWLPLLRSHFAFSLLALAFALSLCLLTFDFRFCAFTFALLFQTFSLSIFFFSSIRKEKKRKRKKTIEKKTNAEKGRSLHFFSRCAFKMKSSSCFLLSTFLQR